MRYKSRKRDKNKNTKMVTGLILILFFCILFLIAIGVFHIRTVEVTGNSHYTKEEIENLVISDKYSTNSLYLYFRYQYLETETIPFIDKIEVSLLSNSRVKIRVYEKGLVGYVEYIGARLYFDKDGTVVESSSELIEDVPCIMGLEFNSLSLYKKLDVEDDSIFDTILTITQLLEKYELAPDRIEFGKDMDLTLHFGNVRVALGTGKELEEKVGRLYKLLPDLEGKSGVFHMENYTADSKFISFEQD